MDSALVFLGEYGSLITMVNVVLPWCPIVSACCGHSASKTFVVGISEYVLNLYICMSGRDGERW